ncbi:MAG: bifunctional DNA-formamidopyrimidine glycosylase/DNA-(apurinic or apyrimidinic site) lyase [Paracoccaceae bacterium]|jgi:formamidopyrimidine-DNA glycosylase
MPELPEVETVRRGLEPVLTGQRIAKADIRREGLRWQFPENMTARLEGQRVERLRRRAKYILIDLDGGESLIIHLGMSGRMLISDGDDLIKHDHVVLDMENGVRITFNDPRRFGMMDLCATEALDEHRLLKDMGPEPLGNAFDAKYLGERLKSRKMPIKSALLDQKIVVGLGNIYVCEALWRAHIPPTQKAGVISTKKMSRLVSTIRDVLTEAIDSGGSSLKDYRQADGELGYFQHNFAVYGREGEPCKTAGCGQNIARIVQSGRSTFYCPKCQK